MMHPDPNSPNIYTLSFHYKNFCLLLFPSNYVFILRIHPHLLILFTSYLLFITYDISNFNFIDG